MQQCFENDIPKSFVNNAKVHTIIIANDRENLQGKKINGVEGS